MHPPITLHPRSLFGRRLAWLMVGTLLFVVGCDRAAPDATRSASDSDQSRAHRVLITEHDDLVSAGLGLTGLKAAAPAPADPTQPSAAELRQRAMYTQYNSLSALHTGTGLSPFEATDLPQVPGVELIAWLELDAIPHRSRVLLQIPTSFDVDRPCLVAAPASGSRGVYGAVPLVAPWALPRGCAVVYTDKGAGTDYVDEATGTAVALNGQRVAIDSDRVGFVPPALAGAQPSSTANGHGVATPHAHAEAAIEPAWGRVTLAAIEWGLAQLNQHLDADFDRGDVATIAAGLSNGGAAVMHALEADQDQWIDAAVAVMPNITPPGVPALYDYAATAALYQPCALGDPDWAAELPFANPLLIGFGPVRCENLAGAGLLDEATPEAARAVLTQAGFDDDALVFSAATVALDVWRSVLVNYASAYTGAAFNDMACGYQFDATTATEADKAQWWATENGTPPSETINIIETRSDRLANDPHFQGLVCLHQLTDTDGMQRALAAIEAQARWPHAVPVEIVHGQVDALIPAALSSRPYVAAARDNGMALNYQEIEGANHFDAFLNALGSDGRFEAILPHGWAAMDRAWQSLQARQEAGEDGPRARPSN